MEYEFKNGILSHKVSDAPYNKRGRNDYEEVADYAIDYVYEQLIRLNLKCVTIPERKRPPEDPVSFIFASESLLLDKADKLLILIHGSGSVRAGVWSRRLLTHDHIDVGSQLSYVRYALSNDYAVLLMNTNLNAEKSDSSGTPATDRMQQQDYPPRVYDQLGGFLVGGRPWLTMAKRGRTIECSKTPEDHAHYVWKNFVQSRRNLLKIAIVAHSYGCRVTSYLISHFAEDFRQRVLAICLTDGILPHNKVDTETKRHVFEVTRLWSCSDRPLDYKLKDRDETNVETVSAGTTEHERSSYAAMQSVFGFIENACKDEDNELLLPTPHYQSGFDFSVLTTVPKNTIPSNAISNPSIVTSGLNLPTIPISYHPDNRLLFEPQDQVSESESESKRSDVSLHSANSVQAENGGNDVIDEPEQVNSRSPLENRLLVKNSNGVENIELAENAQNPISNFGTEQTPIQEPEVQVPQEVAPAATGGEKKVPEKKKKSKRYEQPTVVRVQTYGTYQSIDSSNRAVFDDDEDLNWTDNF